MSWYQFADFKLSYQEKHLLAHAYKNNHVERF